MGRLAGGRLWGAAVLVGVVLLAACAPAGPAAPAATQGASAPGGGGGSQGAAAVQPTAVQPVAAAPASPPPLTRMVVGYGSAGGGYIPLWLAAETKSFERYGLEVELVLLPGNMGPQSLVAGQVPI